MNITIQRDLFERSVKVVAQVEMRTGERLSAKDIKRLFDENPEMLYIHVFVGASIAPAVAIYPEGATNVKGSVAVDIEAASRTRTK
jgi:hypothetical protein